MLQREEILKSRFRGQAGLPCRQRYPEGASGRENRACCVCEKYGQDVFEGMVSSSLRPRPEEGGR